MFKQLTVALEFVWIETDLFLLVFLLVVKKISTRWEPCLLLEENKRNRVVYCEAILAIFRRNPNEFLRRYIAVDKTWIHCCTL